MTHAIGPVVQIHANYFQTPILSKARPLTTTLARRITKIEQKPWSSLKLVVPCDPHSREQNRISGMRERPMVTASRACRELTWPCRESRAGNLHRAGDRR